MSGGASEGHGMEANLNDASDVAVEVLAQAADILEAAVKEVTASEITTVFVFRVLVQHVFI